MANSEEFCPYLNKRQNPKGFTEETAKHSRQKEDLEIDLAKAEMRIKELEGENERLRGLLSKGGQIISQPTNTKDSVTS